MRTFVVCFFVTLFLVFTGCNQSDATDSSAGSGTSIKGDVGHDVCAEFPVDFIHSAINKPIVKVEGPLVPSIRACKWYTEYSDTWFQNKAPGGRFVSIVAENLDIKNQKKFTLSSGGSVGTDPRIKMDHVILYRKNKTIFAVDLLIRPMRYVRVDKTANAITDEEQILFAAKVADKIQGRLDMKINKNPVDLSSSVEDAGQSQEKVARKFFELIGQRKFEGAVGMMDANDQTKSLWLANFKTLKSLKIKKVEEIYREEWTASLQKFKITLDVSTTTQAEQYGWVNGINYRWVTLQKNNSGWQVHELANNP